MKKFGTKSKQRLDTCHKDLQLLCESVLQDMDITILCGTRNEVEQAEAFNSGKSKLKYPDSKHNKTPSLAVDVMPFPIVWDDLKTINAMLDLFEQHSQKLGIELRFGRDFSFKDYDHVELKESK